MTIEELEAIERRANGASPGPFTWDTTECGEFVRLFQVETEEEVMAPTFDVGIDGRIQAHLNLSCGDAEFLAAAQQDVIALCRELRRAWEEDHG